MRPLERGVVRWFDNRSGEGMIRNEAMQSIYVHWSAIADVQEAGLQRPTKQVWGVLFPGQEVAIRVFEDSTFKQIEFVGSVSLLEDSLTAEGD